MPCPPRAEAAAIAMKKQTALEKIMPSAVSVRRWRKSRGFNSGTPRDGAELVRPTSSIES